MDVRGRSASLVSGPEQGSGSSPPLRERSAERRYLLVCTLRCRVPCGHAASRRSTVASSTPGPSRRVRTRDFHPRDPGGFRHLSSGPSGLLSKAALRSKGGRKPRATRTSCARHTGARAPHLLRQPNASGRRPQLSKQADHKEGKANVKSDTCVCKLLQHSAQPHLERKFYRKRSFSAAIDRSEPGSRPVSFPAWPMHGLRIQAPSQRSTQNTKPQRTCAGVSKGV
jgi:hypothetical protein